MFGTLEYEAVMENKPGVEITIDWEASGESTVHSATEVWKLIFDSNQPWILSANGTIFSFATEAIVPSLLKRWYAERKELQAKKKECTDPEEIAFWDKRQLVKKINLNSLYGALLNPGCRFFDKRIGQSTTLTGRTIAKHMDAFVNECITGVYDHTGEAIIYGDTDSCYFSAWPAVKDEVAAGKMEWSKDIAIQLYDNIADQVNDSFPAMMERSFHVPRDMGEVIKGGRELVAEKGLFIKKKRYAVLIVDLEGKRLDQHGKPGKVKAMGLDLKRSDTPKVVQDFLSDILLDVLTGSKKEHIYDKVREFKLLFQERPAWEKGTPKRVNNLTKYGKEEERLGRANMPGHVRAALNWNNLKRMHGDNYSTSIVDGMKTIVCKLKDNPLGYTSVGYPTDEAHIPQWFKDLPFDDGLMETTIVDQKVENLLGVLDWDIPNNTDIKTTFDNLFSFE
jgi:DNA polymerase elongation subunit (family B)